MRRYVQQKIVELRNELKAQKVFSGLAYSQLLYPENTPSQTYTSTANLSGSGETPVARVRFRFTRTDGINETPLVNFAFNASYSPTYKQFAENNGWVFTGKNFDFLEKEDIYGYISGSGDNYVDFYVDYNYTIREALFSLSSIGISVTCQAIVAVNGILSVERVI